MLLRWRRDETRERELRRIKKTIKLTMNSQDRAVRGVVDILFTVDRKETDIFKKKNEACRARGESYFTRVKNDIGSKEKMVVLWIKISSDKSEFLTDIVLSSAQPNHKDFFFGDREGYKLVMHPGMRGLGASDPSLCLWFKKEDTKSRFLADVRVSYTKEDHIDLTRKNYEQLPTCLSNFGCGYANLWVLYASSASMLRLTDSDHIEKELKDYSDMLKKSPDDKILIDLVEKASWRLREKQLAEEDHARDIPGDDLTYTKEFLALRSKDLRKMRNIFRTSIDFDNDGRISVEDYCSFLREPLSMSPFIRQIFAFSAPANGRFARHLAYDAAVLDVGATLKATAVFCCLGPTELMKFLFAWYDTKGYGEIDNKQFLDLLSLFHPRHRDDVVVRALKDIQLSSDGKMSFSKFESESKKFPHIIFPAYRIQARMRKLFFGEKWWKRKLALYTEAKELLTEERKRGQDEEDRERKQRHDVSEELNQLEILEIKKRRRKRGRYKYP